MKKYSKPQIMFESFALSINVASCEMETPLPSENQCGLPTTKGIVFIDATTGCQFVPQNGIYNGLCYHVPTEYNNLFGS